MNQRIDEAYARADWRDLPHLTHWVIEQALAIQAIAAPTFHEEARARYVAEQFGRLGMDQIEIDERYNVYGRARGRHSDRPGLLISAHIDTIFPAETDLSTRRDGDLIYGPGLGDNSVGVAGMLGLAYLLQRQQIIPACDLWFVATSREEGLGDLGGIKLAFERLRERINQVINLEGLAFGHIYHAGIAVRRLKVTATTSGGHSWLHYGRTNAIHALMTLGARITALQPPARPRTTLNIGLIEGGQAINAIATSASFWLDLRSEDSSTLDQFEQRVRAEVEAVSAPDLTLHIEVVGDRPAGSVARNHPLVQAAIASLEKLGIQAALETGSTDGNLPLAKGCPAVTIGITRGGNAHRLDEYIETRPIPLGLQQVVMLALAAADEQMLSEGK